MPFELQEIHLIYAFTAITVVFFVEAAYLLFAGHQKRHDQINRRLQVMAGSPDNQAVLLRLRRERGLASDGGLLLSWQGLNRLLLQSGMTLSSGRLIMIVGVSGIVGFVAILQLRQSLIEAVVGAVAAALLLPLMVFRYKRKKRQANFANQFPDAIDIITRSLRAGHPVPVAIAMVAREMPDPVGTEFGLIADEVTYGSDLETALRSLNVRVGQDDLPLFVTAVAIQNSTGGNLGEILDNIAEVIRQRIKLRRKVRAISAEGRVSAIALTALPLAMFGIIQLASPDYYGEIWGDDTLQISLIATGIWMLFGNVLMYKMVNFKM